MKKESIFAAATIFSLFFAACNDAGDSSSVPEVRGMTLSAQHEEISRTHFDGTATTWSDGDAITVFVDRNVSVPYRFEAVDPAKGTFSNGDIFLGDDEHTFHAIYPAAADATVLDIGAATQTQKGASTEHIAAADPLVGKAVARPSEVAVTMNHTATVLKLDIVAAGLLDAESIASVKIEAPDGVFLHGRHTLDLVTGDVTAITGRCGNATEVAVVGSDDFATDGEFTVWAAVAPFEIPAGEKLVFTIKDGRGGMYRIEKTFPDGKIFSAGKIMSTVLELSESSQLSEINIDVDFTDPNAYTSDFPTATAPASSGTFVFSGHEFVFASSTPFHNREMSDKTRALCFETFADKDTAKIRIPRVEGYAPAVVAIGVHSTIINKQNAQIAIETSKGEITERVNTFQAKIEFTLSDTDDKTDYYIGIYGNKAPCRLSSVGITYARLP